MTTACVPSAMGWGRTGVPWVRLVPNSELVQYVTLPVPDDAELMGAIARTEIGAFERLYERYAAIVFATCLRIMRDRAEAEDLLEEVFWEIWARRDRYDASRSSPFTYLMTLARSRALDRLRFRKRRAGVWLEASDTDRDALAAAGSSGANPFEDAAAGQRRIAIGRALEELPAPHRRAVEMNFFEGLSHREISEQLGDPLGTVKTRIRQGLLTLRKVLQSIDGPGLSDS